MTRIKKLVMDGFKSFAKRTELLFDQPFSVILGANGSGKSNVMDALCFVLGKSSSKAMRAEKSANLIYNGGKTKKPAKQAEVTIVFDNKESIFPIEDKELKVSRMVRQDGSSRYRINGKTRTRTEVLEMLNYGRIDPNGYNIILQGDIVRIVEMSPNDRRGIVEEIAGISLYDEKKNKAVRELDKVSEKLGEAEIILKERHTYLKELKRDRDQALKYKELGDRIKQNKATWLKIQIDRKEEEKSKIDGRSSKHRVKLDVLQSKVKKHRDDIMTRKKEIAEISKEIESKGEVEQVALQKEIEKLKVDVATKKTRIESCKTEQHKNEQKKQHITSTVSELKDKIFRAKKDEEALVQVVEKKQSLIEELSNKIEGFKKKHNLEGDKAIEGEIDAIDEETELLQKQSGAVREKQQHLLREQDRLDFQLQTVDEKISKVIAVEKEHKQEIEQLKRKKEEFKKTVVELNALLNRDSEDAQKLSQMRKEVRSLQEEHHALEVKIVGLREAHGATIAIQKVLENKRKLGQIYDVVSELAQVDDTYATALEIAAGPKINSIVVEDAKTASACISFLKDARLGVATFLPLDKIRGESVLPAARALTKERGVHGLAVNLVRHDPKFKKIFSYVFGSTVVVDSIDVARKLGIGKAKMVSLDGDVAELSGAMKGGFRQKKAVGRFKGAELQKKMERLAEKIAAAQAKMSGLERDRTGAEERITRLRQHKATLEGEIIKAEKSLHLDSDDLLASKNYKKELRQKLLETAKEKEQVEQEIRGFTKKITDLKIRRQELKNKIAQLRNPALIAELNAYDQKRRELVAEVSGHDQELKQLSLQRRDIYERDFENSQRIVKELDKEKEQFELEVGRLSSAVEKINADLVVKEKNQEKFYKQFKTLFERRNILSDEITALENEVLKLEDESRQVELTLNSFSIELARVKAELAGLLAEFEQYQGVSLDMNKPEAELKKEINQFERMLANIGNVNMRALEIYDTVKEEYEGLLDKKKTLLQEKDDVLKLMAEIEERKKELFMTALEAVNNNFQRIFGELSTKGDAYLKLEVPEDPLAGGLLIKVKLTGTKFLDIRSLSGGEKTLTALAFIFAIQEHNPAYFYLLDEVDAALDKKNADMLGQLIKKYCERAQYVVISHNDQVIRQADALYGVTLTPGIAQSKVVSMKV
ncbi:chromosome segregation protein SMC [Candidatus Woesearchaeota archaeon]|nr:chromosome segregation protein SMC [Candidatus Woesearchaeota archaeon]